MQQLFKRVMEGRVVGIPSIYSSDVSTMIKACL